MLICDPELKGNIGRFLNHSCVPNVKVYRYASLEDKPILLIIALQDIKAHEELTWNYGYLIENC